MIADGARPLARVGDVIEHGQGIPSNVVRMRDVSSDIWRRNDGGSWDCFSESGDEPMDGDYADWTTTRLQGFYRTLKVVEVDPEPQPTRCTNGPDCQRHPDADPEYTHEVDGARMHHLGTGCMAPDPAAPTFVSCGHAELLDEIAGLVGAGPYDDLAEWLRRRLNPAAESGPVVLTLPAVPDGAAALVGVESGRRWVPYSGPLADQSPRQWEERNGESFTGRIRDDAGVLFEEGSVTVVMAPPREPRTWPKLDAADLVALGEFPDVVDLIEPDRSPLRFERTAGLRGVVRYVEPGHPEISFTLAELRELGEVREVLA